MGSPRSRRLRRESTATRSARPPHDDRQVHHRRRLAAGVAEAGAGPDLGAVDRIGALHDDGAGERVAALLGGLRAAEDLDPVQIPGGEGAEEGPLAALHRRSVHLDADQQAAVRGESALADPANRKAPDLGGGARVRGHRHHPIEVGIGPLVEPGAGDHRDARGFVPDRSFELLAGHGHLFGEGEREGDADANLALGAHADLDGPVGEAAARDGQPVEPLRQGVEPEGAGGVAGRFPDLAVLECQQDLRPAESHALRAHDLSPDLPGGRRSAGALRNRRRAGGKERRDERREKDGEESDPRAAAGRLRKRAGDEWHGGSLGSGSPRCRPGRSENGGPRGPPRREFVQIWRRPSNRRDPGAAPPTRTLPPAPRTGGGPPGVEARAVP